MVAGLALFYLELVIEPVGELVDQVVAGGLVNEDGDRHVHPVRFVGHLDLLLLEEVQELVMLGIADGDVDRGLENPLDKPGLVDRVGGDVAVCSNEAARAEFNPAEVPGYDGDYVMELSQLEGFQDRDAGGTARLAVIAFPLDLVLIADHVGKAIMVGLAVGGLHLSDEILGGLLRVGPAD